MARGLGWGQLRGTEILLGSGREWNITLYRNHHGIEDAKGGQMGGGGEVRRIVSLTCPLLVMGRAGGGGGGVQGEGGKEVGRWANEGHRKTVWCREVMKHHSRSKLECLRPALQCTGITGPYKET